MKSWIGAGVMMMAAMASGSALAREKPMVLVELFTSQGCSSCPPADELFVELAARNDVLPLALHVDYWDYIGWKDSFARPEHTARQKAYAHEAGSGSIYTPQIVVGGVDHVIGYKPMKLADLMRAHEAGLADVVVEAKKVGESFQIRCVFKAGTMRPGQILVDIVRFDPEEVVHIEHGENAGETITYANIVRDWDRVATWDGTGELVLDPVDYQDGLSMALILQEPGPGRVLAAYKID